MDPQGQTMSCKERVTVSGQAIDWLKEHYPALCIKAGLCERVGGRLYTKTLSCQAPLPAHEIVTMYDESPTCDGDMIAFARAILARAGIGESRKPMPRDAIHAEWTRIKAADDSWSEFPHVELVRWAEKQHGITGEPTP